MPSGDPVKNLSNENTLVQPPFEKNTLEYLCDMFFSVHKLLRSEPWFFSYQIFLCDFGGANVVITW